jgi:hypothetical protein
VQDSAQSFKVTVNLKMLDSTKSHTVSLEIDGNSTVITNQAAPNATSLKQIGYVLDGIDAGIIGADNFRVIRREDIPPP